MIVAGAVVSALALGSLGIPGDWRLASVSLTLLGLGFYMMLNSFQTQVTELSVEACGSAAALHAFSFFTGAAVGRVIFGYGSIHWGTTPTLSGLAALVLALGFVAARVLKATAPQLRAR
jgi:predicted MFS family arabinose efflux permease